LPKVQPQYRKSLKNLAKDVSDEGGEEEESSDEEKKPKRKQRKRPVDLLGNYSLSLF
jgi:hypothetical protein